jgi:superfamily II DNA or RNA helicase
MNKIQLRDYQDDAVSFLNNETGQLVLALCPNAGKTEVTINFINNYLKENNDKRILILAHSTTVLLDNFTNRLSNSDVCFSFSEDLSDNSSVHVSIPQRKNNIVCKYNIIIVDEAHENFLAKTVQQIIKNSSPQKVILLTGTPSKFIGDKKYKFHFYSLSQLKNDFRSNLSIKISNSSYSWDGNYNTQNELKSNFKFTKEDTEASLIEALKNCILNDENDIEKTLIVCKTINQSKLVKDYLVNQNISCVISNSENDLDSLAINDFKNGRHNVLIVVNRARLGFDDSELVNLIDMSGTLNPDLIYQMYSRVCRKGVVENKRYIRLRGNNEKLENTKLAVNISLMLVSKKYLSVYNGKNLSGQQVLMSKEFLNKERKQSDSSSENKKEKKMFFEDVENVVDFYSECLNNDDYKVCSVRDVIKFLGGAAYRKKITYEFAKEICLKYKTPQELYKNDSSIYSWVCMNNKYRKELFSHMKWTERRKVTSNLLKKECSKYTTFSELAKSDMGLYGYFKKNRDLIPVYFSNFKPNNKLNITLESAKKECLKYNSPQELYIKNRSLHKWVIKKKPEYKDELFSHMKRNNVYTYEDVKKLCLKYSELSDFRKKERKTYIWITNNKKNKDDLFSHMKQQPKKINITLEYAKETCLKYSSIMDLRKNNRDVYEWAKRGENIKYKDELYSHIKTNTPITLEYAKECCLKCSRPSELNKKFPSVYNWIVKRNSQHKEELYALFKK